MATPLLDYLRQRATDAERAAIDAAVASGVWSGPDLFFVGGPPDPIGEHRLALRGRAERTLIVVLARALAWADRPRATALDSQAARRVPFDLEMMLRGRERDVDWPVNGWGRFVAIEVEEGTEVAPQKKPEQVTTAERRVAAEIFSAWHPNRSQRERHRLYHAQTPEPTMKIPRKLFPAWSRGRPRKKGPEK